MFYLVYNSTASENINEVDLHDILSACVRNNERLDITGMLIHHEGTFIQLLEGDRDDVHEIYEAIKKDERHFNVITLYKGETEKRFFPRWRMAFEATLEKTFRQVEAYENLNEANNFLINADFNHPGLRLLRYYYSIKRKEV